MKESTTLVIITRILYYYMQLAMDGSTTRATSLICLKHGLLKGMFKGVGCCSEQWNLRATREALS